MALQEITGSAPAPGRPAGSQVPSVDFAEQLRSEIAGVLEAQHAHLQRQLQNQLELQHQRLFAALEAATYHREAAHGGAPVKPDADGDAAEVGQSLGQGSVTETLPDAAAASHAHDGDDPLELPLPRSVSERIVSTLRGAMACAFSPKAENDERPFLRRCIENKVYDFVVMIFVISYSGFIAWQVQTSADRSADAAETTPADETISLEPSSTETRVDRFYLGAFFAEIVLRLAAYGCEFFRGPEWNWNWFDFIAVGTMALEFLLDVIAGTGGDTNDQDDSQLLSQLAVLRILRVVRMVRVVRVIRVMKFFKELRLMLVSMMASCRSLLWALLTLGMVNFVFGVTITQGVVDYLNENNRWSDEESVELVENYGGLTLTMRTLFFAITGGADWGELWLLLYPVSPIYTCVFLLYVSFSILAALNIVTSVFVEASIGMAQEDKEGLIEEAMRNKARYEAELVALFHEMDMDCSGSMTMNELRESLSHPRMRAYLATMEISADDTETILMLFQESESGADEVIDVKEFVYACLKLRGDAKAVDISMLQIQVKEVLRDMRKLLLVAGRLDSRTYALGHGQSTVASGTEHEASYLTSARERQTDVVQHQHPDEAALRPAEAGLPPIAEESITLAVADLPDDGSPSPPLVEKQETPVLAWQQQGGTGGRATAAAWHQQEDVFGTRKSL